MKRIYIGVYGVGLGHASRMVYVADKLDKRNTLLRFSSFGDAVEYIKIHGYSCITVPPVELGWDPNTGFDVKESIMKIPMNFINLIRQSHKEICNIGKFKPNLIISDTRLTPLLPSKLYDIPSITILNQIKLLLSNKLRELSLARLFEDMLAEFLGLCWRNTEDIIVPDLPPPYTLSEDNLWNIGSISKRLKYIGFLAPKPIINKERLDRVRRMLYLDSKPVIFAHISGPSKTKELLTKNIIDLLSKRDDINFIISEGKPNGSIDARRIRNGWYYEWCPIRDEIFAQSDLLIVRGGHATLSQAILYGKPVISIPIENHGEQIGNAKKIDKLGIGLMLVEKDIDKLNEYVDRVLNDDKYKKNVENVKELAYRLDSINALKSKIEEY